jgi:hypothetical protein
MEFISENLKIIILAAIALLAGIVIRVVWKKNKNNNSNNVKQKGNKAGGDMAGRDINR